MIRPPSRADVQAAQSHLVLLKSKMRQRRQSSQSTWSGNGYDDQMIRQAEDQQAAAREHRGVTWDPPTSVDDIPVGPSRGQQNLGRTPAVSSSRDGYENGYPSSPSNAKVGASGGLSNSIDGLQDAIADGGPLIPCPDCGRSFNEESLVRHRKICKKVFQQKRKQFNSAAARLGEFDNAQELIANAVRLEKEKDASAKTTAPEKGGKVPKWKAQSLAFRQAILNAKAAGGDEEAARQAAEIQKEINAANLAAGGNAMEADMTKCPHCGRTFNKEAGERHIAICVKTFGTKPGGGRLVKGGGAAKIAPPTSSSSRLEEPKGLGGPTRLSSGPSGAGAAGYGAAARRPSAQRNRR